jgi:hypothetical protein
MNALTAGGPASLISDLTDATTKTYYYVYK